MPNTINVLFPGRHHMSTKFQHEYLRNLVKNGIDDQPVGQIIFAVTSANHENTRRNPVPFYLRAIAIEKFASDLNCDYRIYPIPDIKPNDKFASYIIKQIFYQSGEDINPNNTVLACSTPNVIKLFKKLGFKNLPVELSILEPETYSALRPYEIIDLLLNDAAQWKEKHSKWREHAHAATQNIYDEYALGDLIVKLFQDSLLTEDAEITETRDYDTYSRDMDNIIDIKFNDIKPFVIQGKIVDVGSSTGSLVRLLAREFSESDIIGIEATRKFYEFARSQEYDSPYVFFYRRNVTDQNFKENSVNTFVCSSILHEIYSYLGEATLINFIKSSLGQLAYGGRLIIRDVVGPENPDQEVYMELAVHDGSESGDLAKLSTYGKFFSFVEDFIPRKIRFEKATVSGKSLIKLRLQDAYEFMSKKNYVDNWQSEMHEEFGFYSFSQWCRKLENAGFVIVPGSHPFKNEYVLENSYKNKVGLYSMVGSRLVPMKYPPTNMILVGEKA